MKDGARRNDHARTTRRRPRVRRADRRPARCAGRRRASSAARRSRWMSSSQEVVEPLLAGTAPRTDADARRCAYDRRRDARACRSALLRRGKVRDVYEVDADRLLLVATDRVSAFDVVMRETIPYKGAVLTQISAWWLGQLAGVVPHHLISADADEIVREVPALAEHRELPLRAARCCVGARKCFRSSASFAVIFPGRPGRSTRGPGRSPASRFRRGCGRATSWRSVCSAPPRRRRPATTRTSRSPACAR